MNYSQSCFIFLLSKLKNITINTLNLKGYIQFIPSLAHSQLLHLGKNWDHKKGHRGKNKPSFEEYLPLAGHARVVKVLEENTGLRLSQAAGPLEKGGGSTTGGQGRRFFEENT